MFASDRLFTFLKPAHMWNRQASLKHAIEQNDESPRGHPGHSTMARPSGPNAGSAHVLRAPSPKVQKVKGEQDPYRKRGPASSVPADRPDVALDFLANAVGFKDGEVISPSLKLTTFARKGAQSSYVTCGFDV